MGTTDYPEFSDLAIELLHARVSQAVNMHVGAMIEHVRKVFLAAYHLGCKGVTVFRDGSRDVQTWECESDNVRNIEQKSGYYYRGSLGV